LARSRISLEATATQNNSDIGPTKDKKVLIFVVCYKAADSIESVLSRIPADIWNNELFGTEVLVIDNQSPDRTFYAAENYSKLHPHRKVTVLYNPKSQGYGGNQKIGFRYAIERGFDAIVLLHGDNRYAPECLPEMIKPILENGADAVLGSRMIRRSAALKEGMPRYKLVGNQVLTLMQNWVLGSRLSEFHSGYRSYSTKAIKSIPFEHNSNGFDFDTDILIQFLGTGKNIAEVAVPTFYGNEIAGAHGLGYVIKVLHSSILSRVTRLGIYYHPKFDYEPETNCKYKSKFGYLSSHQFAYDQVGQNATVIDIGCGPGFMTEALTKKASKTVSVDRQIQPTVRQHSWKCVEANIDEYDFGDDVGKVDCILALDIIEHLKSPEKLLAKLRKRYSRDYPSVVITTGNIAFLPIRASLLFAGFHYGRRGILDMDHTRLFTFSSLARTLQLNGYEVVSKRGLPAPFPLAVGNGPLAKFLMFVNCFLIKISKSVFSYQIAVVAKPLPTLEHLLEDAFDARRKKLTTDNNER
jgi:glycosyltransferase involved in cell wall biosynthesis